MSNEIKIGKIVGRIDNTIVFIIDKNVYADGICRYTYAKMRMLTNEEIEEYNEFSRLRDYFRECWMRDVSNGRTELGLDDWMETAIVEHKERGELFPGDDTSYRYDVEKAYDSLSSSVQFRLLGVRHNPLNGDENFHLIWSTVGTLNGDTFKEIITVIDIDLYNELKESVK